MQFTASGASVATVSGTAVPLLDVGAFTIEWWQWVGSNSPNIPLVFSVQSPLGTTQLGVSLESTAVLWALGGSMTSSYSPVLCTWQHMAVVRSGNTLTLFAAGSSVASWTVAASANFTGTALNIGGNGTASRRLTGLISCFRVVVGSALYTTASAPFAPPSQPPSPIPGTVLLLLASSSPAVLTDSSFVGVTLGGSGVAWNSASPFTCYGAGSGSLLFNYTATTMLTVPNAAANFGTAPFTIEYWTNSLTPMVNQRSFSIGAVFLSPLLSVEFPTTSAVTLVVPGTIYGQNVVGSTSAVLGVWCEWGVMERIVLWPYHFSPPLHPQQTTWRLSELHCWSRSTSMERRLLLLQQRA